MTFCLKFRNLDYLGISLLFQNFDEPFIENNVLHYVEELKPEYTIPPRSQNVSRPRKNTEDRND